MYVLDLVRERMRLISNYQVIQKEYFVLFLQLKHKMKKDMTLVFKHVLAYQLFKISSVK